MAKQRTRKKANHRAWECEYLAAHTAFSERFVGLEKPLRQLSSVYATYSVGLEQGTHVIAPRVLLTGPLSSGKTCAARMLADLLKLPSISINLGALAPESYKGTTLSDSLNALIDRAGDIRRLEQYGGVIHLDEVCKIVARSKSDELFSHISHNLLALLGGEAVMVQGEYESAVELNTQKLLVVMTGAFTGVTATQFRNFDTTQSLLQRLGYPSEFVSRISHYVRFEKLPQRQVLEVVTREAEALSFSYSLMDERPTLSRRQLTLIANKVKGNRLGLRASRTYIHREFTKQCEQRIASGLLS